MTEQDTIKALEARIVELEKLVVAQPHGRPA
jgi:hypothetical protein